MVFIRKNKYILAMILGIVSMALMFPSITNMIKNMKDNEFMIFRYKLYWF